MSATTCDQVRQLWQDGRVAEDVQQIRRIFLGRLIRERRAARGLSIEDASRAAGVSRQTWRNVEAGQAVRDAKLGQIENALGWGPGSSFDILGSRADEPKPFEPVPADARPVGTGVDPLDLSVLTPEDQDYIRGLYERLRQQRGE